MIRKLMVLTSFLWVVSLASAATVWNPAANGIVPPATGNWADAANWTNGLPDDTEKAVFNVPDAAECVVSDAQSFKQFVQGDNGPGGLIRVMDGGSLATGTVWSAVGYNHTAHMTVEAGGTVNFGEHMWVGLLNGSVGTLDINGGTVTVAQMIGLGWDGGTGFVNVNDGGLLALSNIHGDGSSSIKDGLLSINGSGVVTLPGDFVGVIETYAAAGLIAGNGVLGAVEAVAADGITTVTAVATAGLASEIEINNPGFEAPAYAEGAYGPTDGWTLGYYTLPDTTTWVGGGTDESGGFNPTAAEGYGGVAPEGENVAYTSSFAGYDTGLSQILSATLEADTQYDLSVLVGNPVLYNEGLTADYRIELLAGGVLLASDTGPSPVDDTTWTTASLSYNSGANPAQLGQPLEIRLLAVDFADWYEVHYDNVTLSYVTGAEPGVTIPVDPDSDIAAANELAQAGDTIEFAEGTYYIASQIEVKDGVTYRGAGPGLTIIDGNNTTRAFVAWGDRFFNEDNENANDSGPKGWVLEGMTIQNCVADTNNRFSYVASAFDMNDVFAENDADGSGGLSPDEADADSGGIRLPGPDGTEGTEDDDLHRFDHMDTDGNGELSQAELLAQIAVAEDEFGDENGDGGAVDIHNGAVGTIQNCEFLNNHTPIPGDGDDGGAINIAGLSVVTINDCLFDGNYACSPNSVAEEDETGTADGDGGHIKLQGGSVSAMTPGTTLIANRCLFLNGNAEDDGGAIQAAAVGAVVRLDSCWFEGNTSWDNGNVCQFMNNAQHEVTVTNCIFVNNVTKADNSPDRMIETNRNSRFINCTFVGNVQEDQDIIYNNANTEDTDADGVDDETADATQVINCIFANNVVGNGDDVLGSRNNDFTIVATNCLFFGNTLQNGNAADNTQRPAEETGSVLEDPLLDVNLVPGVGSPAIDAGVDPSIVGVILTTDYNGDPRPQGAAYDIGAYEVAAAPPVE